jgi:hypothetical protein
MVNIRHLSGLSQEYHTLRQLFRRLFQQRRRVAARRIENFD